MFFNTNSPIIYFSKNFFVENRTMRKILLFYIINTYTYINQISKFSIVDQVQLYDTLHHRILDDFCLKASFQEEIYMGAMRNNGSIRTKFGI